MTRSLRLIAVSAVVSALCGSARAGLIWDQQPLDTGGPGADTDFFNDSNQRVWQLVADNFQLAADIAITQVRWWGFYGGQFSGSVQPPPGDESIRLRFYSPREGDGLPGSVLYEQVGLNGPRSTTGRVVFDTHAHPEFLFEANLAIPFSAAAGQAYWLEIVQLGDSSSSFRWEYSFSSVDDRYVFLNARVPDWTQSELFRVSLAFQLVAIPESTTFGTLLFAGISTLVSRRGRQEARAK